MNKLALTSRHPQASASSTLQTSADPVLAASSLHSPLASFPATDAPRHSVRSTISIGKIPIPEAQQSHQFTGANCCLSSYLITSIPRIDPDGGESALRPTHCSVTFSSDRIRTRDVSLTEFEALLGRLRMCEIYTHEDAPMGTKASSDFKALFNAAAEAQDLAALLQQSRIAKFKD